MKEIKPGTLVQIQKGTPVFFDNNILHTNCNTLCIVLEGASKRDETNRKIKIICEFGVGDVYSWRLFQR